MFTKLAVAAALAAAPLAAAGGIGGRGLLDRDARRDAPRVRAPRGMRPFASERVRAARGDRPIDEARERRDRLREQRNRIREEIDALQVSPPLPPRVLHNASCLLYTSPSPRD